MIRRTAALAFSQSSDRIKVAILGSGISGCSVASTLVNSPSGNNFDITLYEGGFGVGGRMSTREILDDDGDVAYQFDHGCQSIDPPKTKVFEDEFCRWKERGWIRPWKGKFATIGYNSIDATAASGSEKNQAPIKCETREEERYVGYPRMNSICENLLLQRRTNSDQSSNIEVVTRTQARATHLPSFPEAISDSDRMWQCEQVTREGAKVLGDFDWLIVTDRNSAQDNRFDLREANVKPYIKSANEEITSLKSIAAMVAFDKPLPLSVNGIEIDHDGNRKQMKEKFGTLGWIARDSSKPGRQGNNGEDDSVECWVLHANRREGERLLGLKELKGASLGKIRGKIKETMVEDFIKSIPLLMSMTSSNDGEQDDQQQLVEIPKIIRSMGHRWGAAFPLHIEKNGEMCMYRKMECYVDDGKQFIACGDYFGGYHGSVEGAFLSGRAAANHLIEQVTDGKK
ncbi:hypothetical protein ACHAXR_007388 [Thalassiosira sp. AJA248-18]